MMEKTAGFRDGGSVFRLYPGRGCLILAGLIVILAGCILSPEKGKNEPETPVAPAATSLSISEGNTFHTRNLTVTWKGNSSAKFFRITLDGEVSGWFDSTSVNLADLVEGEHIFTVQARSDSVIGDPLTVRFVVDAVTGAGIRFLPSSVSSTSSVILLIEDATGLMAAHIEISCPDSSARMREFVPGSAITAGGFLLFSDERDPYRLILDIGFPGLAAGFSGTIEIGSFLVSPVKTSGLIRIDETVSRFRDAANAPLSFERFEPLRIER
jgi:hypothetical protein